MKTTIFTFEETQLRMSAICNIQTMQEKIHGNHFGYDEFNGNTTDEIYSLQDEMIKEYNAWLKAAKIHPLQALANKLKELNLSMSDASQLQFAVNSLSWDDSHSLIEFINRCEGADHYERANEAFKQLKKYL